MQDQVRQLIAKNRLGEYLEHRYPGHHDVQNDKALYAYTMSLRQEHLHNVPGLGKMLYDNELDAIQRALGLHTAISRVQGGRFKTKKEIRMASLFKDITPEFLRAIVVHKPAHLKGSEHNEASYQPCQYILPDYYQLGFNLRAYPTWKSL